MDTRSERLAGPRSPLKDRPLRNPGQSLDEEIQKVTDDQAMAPFAAVIGLWAVTLVEWIGAWKAMPRRPWIYTLVALAGSAWLIWRVIRVRARVRQLRQGRDGEMAVGQYLEGLRGAGSRIFHDVPAGNFNLDHVVISTHGIFVVETKTITKPKPDAKVVFDGEQITIAGWKPDRDPVKQAAAEAGWLARLLKESTGLTFPVRGVVVFPGWWVDQMNKERRRKVWVLEPKALPTFIEREPAKLTSDEVAMAAFHLSRYVRGENRSKE
jgi:hypothetical protein